MIKIDKSVFSAEELEQYEALIAKATVNPEANEDEGEKPPVPKKKKEEVEEKEVEKSDELSPEVKKALEEVEELKKSLAMAEMKQVAKKYAPLGKKEDELTATLYDMKKSNEANYNAYISVLDEQLALVEKSGMFAEIGKSAGGYTSGGSTVDKIQAKASEIMKADPNIDYNTAVCKAWEESPDLMAEYDSTYRK